MLTLKWNVMLTHEACHGGASYRLIRFVQNDGLRWYLMLTDGGDGGGARDGIGDWSCRWVCTP